MIMFDSHMHTTFSTDSKMEIGEALKRAEELNIGIITTEHLDLNYPGEGKFIFNLSDYFKEYSKHRSQKVLLGIELGMITDQVSENKQVAESYPFDFVIGSTHLVNNVDIFQKEFYLGKSKKESYEQYFEYMLQCVKTHSFVDSIGHIDYISRYSIYEDKEIYYEDFSEYIDEVLKVVARNNIALELNTRRLNISSAVINLQKIYKRFHELGGKMITIGSDSHNAASIGTNFDVAKTISESAGLRIVYFKERTPEYISL